MPLLCVHVHTYTMEWGDYASLFLGDVVKSTRDHRKTGNQKISDIPNAGGYREFFVPIGVDKSTSDDDTASDYSGNLDA